MPEPDLHSLQNWMKTVITTRGDLPQKLEQARNAFNISIEDTIESKRGVSAQRRIDIYAAGYVLRLLECMKCDFPALQAFMGEELFTIFAKAYIVSLPSRSWSLYRLSERFPGFLRSTAPQGSLPGSPEQDLFELPAEIAAYERLVAEVAVIAGIETDPRFQVPVNVESMHYLLEETTVLAAPCLRLLQQPFPLQHFIHQLQEGIPCQPPARKETYMAFSRTHYRVRMAELEPWQFAFLQACGEPTSLHDCAQQAAEKYGLEVKAILATLFIWLPVAMEMGFVTSMSNDH